MENDVFNPDLTTKEANQILAKAIQEAINSISDTGKLPFLADIPSRKYERMIRKAGIVECFPTPLLKKLFIKEIEILCAVKGRRVDRVIQALRLNRISSKEDKKSRFSLKSND